MYHLLLRLRFGDALKDWGGSFSEEVLSDKGAVESLIADEESLAQKLKNVEDANMEVDIALNVKTQLATINEK